MFLSTFSIDVTGLVQYSEIHHIMLFNNDSSVPRIADYWLLCIFSHVHWVEGFNY